jgi:hypothetical protein
LKEAATGTALGSSALALFLLDQISEKSLKFSLSGELGDSL